MVPAYIRLTPTQGMDMDINDVPNEWRSYNNLPYYKTYMAAKGDINKI